jgi:hypothetical protein
MAAVEERMRMSKQSTLLASWGSATRTPSSYKPFPTRLSLRVRSFYILVCTTSILKSRRPFPFGLARHSRPMSLYLGSVHGSVKALRECVIVPSTRYLNAHQIALDA